jgi:hypothetical protein
MRPFKGPGNRASPVQPLPVDRTLGTDWRSWRFLAAFLAMMPLMSPMTS